MSIWLMLVLFFILANLPWIGDRVFFVYALEHKSNWIRLLELVVYFFLTLLIGIAFEISFSGEVYSQGWEFFVTVLSLFLVLSVPGVVYRYQWVPMQHRFK